MKFYSLIFIFFSISVLCQKIDTLEQLINAQKPYSQKISQLKTMADQLSTTDFDKSMYLVEKSLKIASKNRDKISEGEFLRIKGNAHYFKGNYDSCTRYFFKSLEILEKEKAKNELAQLYNNLGRFNRKIKNFPRALSYYDKAMQIYMKLKNEEGVATIYNESGVVYEYKEDYDEAVRRYKKSLEIRKKHKDLVGEGYATEFIGGAFLAQKNYEKAEKYLLEALDIRKKTKDNFSIALNYNVLGKLYFETEKFKESQDNFNSSNSIAEKMGYLDLMASNYQKLAQIYEKLGQYNLAYQNLGIYKKINDSIFNLGKTKQIEELSIKYETAEKDNEILENKNKIFKRNIYILSLLGILILGAGVALSIFRHRRKNEKIKLQREILNQQELAAKAVMNAEDNERRRMATGLHDGVAQLLGAANMNISVLEDFKNDEESFNKILEKTQHILGEAIQDVRSLSHQMMPSMLMNHTLKEALTLLVEKSESPKLKINFTHIGNNTAIDEHIEVVVFRTVQEAINNAVKHGNATEITIFSEQLGDQVSVSVKDNGKGFEVNDEKTNFSGLGLQNIRSRINLLKGEMNVTSNENGTKLYIKIPFKN